MECYVCQNESEGLTYCSRTGCLNKCHSSCMYEDEYYCASFCSVNCCQEFHTSRLPNHQRVWNADTLKEFMEARDDMEIAVARAEKFFAEHRVPEVIDAQELHEAGEE